jgi:hypothetical protein
MFFITFPAIFSARFTTSALAMKGNMQRGKAMSHCLKWGLTLAQASQ